MFTSVSWESCGFILISSSYPVPNLFLICYAEPKHLKTPPLTMIPTLVDKASASSIEWVVKMTEHYLRVIEIPATTSHMNLLASGSIPADGSSRRMIGGFPIRAIATCNFRLFPPDRVPASLSLCSSRFNWLIVLFINLVRRAGYIPLMRAK